MLERLIIIGGSAGSFRIVHQLLSELPAEYPHPLILCMHRLRNIRSGFAETLAVNSKLAIHEPCDNEQIRRGIVYLAPSNYHMMIEFGYHFSLSVSAPVNHSRPSIDITMETAAEVFRERAVGIILSGANMDGSRGLARIREFGGTTIVQDPSDSEISTMPTACLNTMTPDHILKKEEIIRHIIHLGS